MLHPSQQDSIMRPLHSSHRAENWMLVGMVVAVVAQTALVFFDLLT